MAETRLDHKERKGLKVTWASEPQSLPNKPEVKFIRCNCDDGLQYETFRQTLFPYIQAGKELDADVELHITKAQDGTEYPHWRIAQLYEKNEPIAKLPSPSKPKEYRGRDEDRTDQRTFVLEFGSNYRAGKWTDKHPLYSTYLNTLTLWGTGVKTEVIKQEPKEIPVADIKKAMKDYHWSEGAVTQFIRKDKQWKVKSLGELNQAQRSELIKYIKSNPK